MLYFIMKRYIQVTAALVLMVLPQTGVAQQMVTTFTPKLTIVGGGPVPQRLPLGGDITLRLSVDVSNATTTRETGVALLSAPISLTFTPDADSPVNTATVESGIDTMLSGYRFTSRLVAGTDRQRAGNTFPTVIPSGNIFNYVGFSPNITKDWLFTGWSIVGFGLEQPFGSWCVPVNGSCNIPFADFTFTMPAAMGHGTLVISLDALVQPSAPAARMERIPSILTFGTRHLIAIADPVSVSGESSAGFDVHWTRIGNAAPAEVSMPWAVAAGTANAADFQGGRLPGGTVRFRQGDSSVRVNIALADDSLTEAAETFTVTLGPPSINTFSGIGIAVDQRPVTATIPASDPIIAITANNDTNTGDPDVDVAEGGRAEFTVSLTPTVLAPATGAVTVTWTVAAGTATAADFPGGTLPSGTLRFSSNATSHTITVAIADDSLTEAAETFTVTLSAPNPTTLGGVDYASDQSAVTATIAANDATIAITANNDTNTDDPDVDVAEGDSAEFTVTLNLPTPAPPGTVSVPWSVMTNTAAAADFQGGTVPGGTLSFDRDNTRRTITVAIADDLDAEIAETFTIALDEPSSGHIGGINLSGDRTALTTTIAASDPTIAITANNDTNTGDPDVDVAEGGRAEFTVSLTPTVLAPATGAVTVTWTVAAGTATAADFPGDALPSGTLSFDRDNTDRTIAIPIASDSVTEGFESFTVTLGMPSPATIGDIVFASDSNPATVTIMANEASIAITANNDAEPADPDVDVAEGGRAEFTVTLDLPSSPPSGVVTVTWTVAAGTATAADFQGGTLPNGTLSFDRDNTRRTITVAIEDDLDAEIAETFTVALGAPNPATIGGGIGVVTDNTPVTATIAASDPIIAIIANNDLDPIDFDVDVAEGGRAEFTVTLTPTVLAPATGMVTVTWTVAAGTATAADFQGGTLPNGTLSFDRDNTRRTIAVQIANDLVGEGAETFTVALGAPSPITVGGTNFVSDRTMVAATIAPGDSVIDIISCNDTDTSDSDVDVAEGQIVQCSVGLHPRPVSEGTVTVTWAVATGTATAADFPLGTLPSGTLRFGRDRARQTIRIRTNNDSLPEEPESFTFALGAPNPTTIGSTPILSNQTSRTVTIAASDPGLYVGDFGHRVEEGDTAEIPVSFAPASLMPASGVTVDWRIATILKERTYVHWGGPLGAGADMSANLGPPSQSLNTLSFDRNHLRRTVAISIIRDIHSQRARAFGVDFQTPSQGIPLISLYRSSRSSWVDVELYINSNLSLLRIETPGTVNEGSNILLSLQNINIPIRQLRPIRVTWSVQADTATAFDFRGGTLPSGTFNIDNTITAVNARQEARIPIAADSFVEDPETFTITLSASTASATALAVYYIATTDTTPVTVTINADDPVITFTPGSPLYSFAEGETAEFPVTFAPSVWAQGAVSWRVTTAGGDTDANAADFMGGTLPSGTLSFDRDNTNRTIAIPIAANKENEGYERFTVTTDGFVARRPNGTFRSVPAASVAAFILPSPAVIDITGSNDTNRVDRDVDVAEGGRAEFTVSFPAPSGVDIAAFDVSWAVAAGTANAADFLGGTLPSGTLNFSSSATSHTITVAIADDSAAEVAETFTVALSTYDSTTVEGINIVSDSTPVPATIAASDPTIAITADPDVDVAEGDSAEFTVTLTPAVLAPATGALTVTWAVAADTATVADFQGGNLPSGSLSFDRDNTSHTITVAIADDSAAEAVEAFTLALGSPEPATIDGVTYASDSTPVTATIAASDPTIAITANNDAESADPDVDVAEGDSAEFTVTLTPAVLAPATGAVTVTWAVAADTATAADFQGGTLPKGSLIFSSSDTSHTITVAIEDDSAAEAAEAFTLALGSPEPAAIDGVTYASDSTPVTATIAANDPTIAITASNDAEPADPDVDVAEGGRAEFTVTLTPTVLAPATGALTVTWAVAADTATAADFQGGNLPSGSLSFDRDNTSHTITVQTKMDTVTEVAETFFVTLSEPNPATIDGVTYASDSTPVTATIAASDPTIAITANNDTEPADPDVDVAEGDSAEFTVTLTPAVLAPATGAVTVTWAVAADTATVADFQGGNLPSGSLSFDRDNTSHTITVAIADDSAAEAAEAFTLALGSPEPAAIDGVTYASDSTPVTATIAANDPTIAITASNDAEPADPDVDVAEGDSAEFTVTLTPAVLAPATGAVTVTWAVAADTATVADFQGGNLPSGSLSFDRDNTNRTIAIQTHTDAVAEAAEVFTLALGSPEPAAIDGVTYASDSTPVTATIAANDPTVALADVNEDGELDHEDALIMYRAYLGILEDDAMSARANSWRKAGKVAGGDLNNDTKIDHQDALLMYYAYQFLDLLDAHQKIRAILLSSLVAPNLTAPQDAELRDLLRRAKQLRVTVNRNNRPGN